MSNSLIVSDKCKVDGFVPIGELVEYACHYDMGYAVGKINGDTVDDTPKKFLFAHKSNFVIWFAKLKKKIPIKDYLKLKHKSELAQVLEEAYKKNIRYCSKCETLNCDGDVICRNCRSETEEVEDGWV